MQRLSGRQRIAFQVGDALLRQHGFVDEVVAGAGATVASQDGAGCVGDDFGATAVLRFDLAAEHQQGGGRDDGAGPEREACGSGLVLLHKAWGVRPYV